MNVKQVKYGFLRTIGNLLLGKTVTLLCRTLRVEKVNEIPLLNLHAESRNYVLAFWHGSMLYAWYAHSNMNVHALTSQSKDGGLLARILEKWDYNVVRGSSSQGGKVALGILVDILKYEGSVAITPDGPRGPEYIFKPGAVIAAQRSGTPLVLLGIGYQKMWRLGSWDKFQIPKPFSKVKLIYSDPIVIPLDAGRQQITDTITDCGNKLNDLQSKAGVF